VTGESNKSNAQDPDLDAGWDFDDGEEESEASTRPTMAPPFDLETYAKEAMIPGSAAPKIPASDLKDSAPPIVPNKVISVVPSSPAPGDSDPSRPAQRPLSRPPPLTMDGPDFAPSSQSQPPTSEPPSQRITPREMKRLDEALRLSRSSQTATPSGTATPSRGPRADTLLTMANSRATSVTPVRVTAVQPLDSAPELASDKEAPPVSGGTNPVVEMQERFALGDYSGALVMAESMLEENPSHVEAREYADSCRAILQQMYTARIGPLDRVPVVEIARDQLRWLSIDHRTGFILSLVDGVSSLEMILDVCGMPPLDALRMLFELVQQRIISIKE
jgi:hypothetical protein